MRSFICANCMKDFRHSVIEYDDGGFEYNRFQLFTCPHCEHFLYWAERTKTNVAKLFEDYSKATQATILHHLMHEGECFYDE